MKLAVAEEMRKIDQIAMEEIGIPGIVLMEHAAQAVAVACLDFLAKSPQKDTLVLCGSGNNGGDGFAVARLLKQRGVPVSILLAAAEEKLSGDAFTNYQIAKKLEIPIYTDKGLGKTAFFPQISILLKEQALIVDALLGTGLQKEVREPIYTIITMINEKNLPVFSIDVPTGINTEDGSICGIALKAKKTITLGLGKPGLYLYPGMEYAGEVTIADIGIPQKVMENLALSYSILTEKEATALLPKRPLRSNKGSYGKLLTIAGSRNMAGAAMFAARAGYLMGAGLVYACVPQCLTSILQTSLPEAITVGLLEEEGKVSAKSFPMLKASLEKATAVILGPGLSEGEAVRMFVYKVLEECKCPILLDADGLNAVASQKEVLKKAQADCVITPHPGELSRLCGKTVTEILLRPVEAAKEFARAHHVITVLKDARTIAAHPDGRVTINLSGNPAMAKAGAGDVLSGMIGGLLAQGMSPYEAACLGIYCHGKTGDWQAKRRGGYSVLASDLLQAIPPVLKRLS